MIKVLISLFILIEVCSAMTDSERSKLEGIKNSQKDKLKFSLHLGVKNYDPKKIMPYIVEGDLEKAKHYKLHSVDITPSAPRWLKNARVQVSKSLLVIEFNDIKNPVEFGEYADQMQNHFLNGRRVENLVWNDDIFLRFDIKNPEILTGFSQQLHKLRTYHLLQKLDTDGLTHDQIEKLVNIYSVSDHPANSIKTITPDTIEVSFHEKSVIDEITDIVNYIFENDRNNIKSSQLSSLISELLNNPRVVDNLLVNGTSYLKKILKPLGGLRSYSLKILRNSIASANSQFIKDALEIAEFYFHENPSDLDFKNEYFGITKNLNNPDLYPIKTINQLLFTDKKFQALTGEEIDSVIEYLETSNNGRNLKSDLFEKLEKEKLTELDFNRIMTKIAKNPKSSKEMISRFYSLGNLEGKRVVLLNLAHSPVAVSPHAAALVLEEANFLESIQFDRLNELLKIYVSGDRVNIDAIVNLLKKAESKQVQFDSTILTRLYRDLIDQNKLDQDSVFLILKDKKLLEGIGEKRLNKVILDSRYADSIRMSYYLHKEMMGPEVIKLIRNNFPKVDKKATRFIKQYIDNHGLNKLAFLLSDVDFDQVPDDMKAKIDKAIFLKGNRRGYVQSSVKDLYKKLAEKYDYFKKANNSIYANSCMKWMILNWRK